MTCAPRCVLLAALLIGGCSRQDTGSLEASGQQLFQQLCQTCHAPAANGRLFVLQKARTPAAIAEWIQHGNWLMPAFPKLHPQTLTRLSDYVFAYSDTADSPP